MAKQKEELYTGQAASIAAVAPRCVVRGCDQPPAATVAPWSYVTAYELFHGRVHKAQRKTRNDPPIDACRAHAEDPRFRVSTSGNSGCRWSSGWREKFHDRDARESYEALPMALGLRRR